jgi:hypothetical protein
MALDPVTAALQLGANLVTGGVQVAGDVISTTQTRRLDAANQKATDDAKNFKDALLRRDAEYCSNALSGLRTGILVDLTDAESEQLRGTAPGLTSLGLLGLYCRGRSADLAAERAEILIDTASTVSGGAK